MTQDGSLRFGPFVLAGRNGPLLKFGEEVHLRPKACGVLWVLASRAGEVVPKSELFQAVWPRVIVGDDALAAQVQSLRHILGDEARTPRYIATVHGVGFRFISKIDRPLPVAHAGPPPSDIEYDRLIVGRESEMESLRLAFADAASGTRRVVFVSGEAGIGKSALVEDFVDQIRRRTPNLRYSHGACAEHSGTGEAFMSILEALGRLCRRDKRVLATLREFAPITLEQIGLPMSNADLNILRAEATGARPARVLRELADAVDALCVNDPMLLLLEDLHWSDTSTAELLSLLARRRAPARLMLLCTLRTMHAGTGNRAATSMKQSLVSGRHATELPLENLDIADVTAYVVRRFPEYADPDGLSALVYRRSEGNPLFMVHLVNDLALRPGDRFPASAEHSIPRGLADLISSQLARLPQRLRITLEVASVVGSPFAVAGVAAGQEVPLETAEEQCAELARQGPFIEDNGLCEWPDGTQTGSYRFRHILYTQVLRQQMPSARVCILHRLVAQRMEAAFGSHVQDVSSELAVHYESARNADKAIGYRILAARKAQARIAPHEALFHASRGLEWVHRLPASAHARQLEFALLLITAHARSLSHGYSDIALTKTLDRIETLSGQIDDPGLLAHGLTLLWLFHHYHSRFGAAIAYGDRLIELGEHGGHPDTHCMGLAFKSVSLQRRGAYRAAEVLSARALELAGSTNLQEWRVGTSNAPAVTALISQSLTRWFLGFPDQSMAHVREAVALEERSGTPYSLCGTFSIGYIMTLVCRRDPALLLEACDKAIVMCTRHQHTEGLAFATKYRGIALCMAGRATEGLTAFRRAVAAQRRNDISHTLIFDYGHEAEFSILSGLLRSARIALNQANDLFSNEDDRAWKPELLRIEGELLLAERGKPCIAVEECFLEAMAMARGQEARSLELRAATSLARMRLGQDDPDDVVKLLQPIYDRFTEGHDAPDLQVARTLLDRARR